MGAHRTAAQRRDQVCSVVFCDSNLIGGVGDLCLPHYQQTRSGKGFRPVRGTRAGSCRAPWCTRPMLKDDILCAPCNKRRLRYGLSNDQYCALPTACEVCGVTRRLVIDHDHATGAYRGLLCHRCNSALGFADDQAEKLRSLAAYLERGKWG